MSLSVVSNELYVKLNRCSMSINNDQITFNVFFSKETTSRRNVQTNESININSIGLLKLLLKYSNKKII